MTEKITNWLLSIGVQDSTAELLTWVALVLAVLLTAFLSNFVAKRILLGAISVLVKKTKTTWDDVLEKRHVFARLSHLAPAMIVYASATMFAGWAVLIQRASVVYMILAGLLVVNGFLNAVNDIYSSFDISRNKPIKGYLTGSQNYPGYFCSSAGDSGLAGSIPGGTALWYWGDDGGLDAGVQGQYSWPGGRHPTLDE